MSATIINIIIQLIAGAVGGNAAGAGLKDYNLGTLGNTIAGATPPPTACPIMETISTFSAVPASMGRSADGAVPIVGINRGVPSARRFDSSRGRLLTRRAVKLRPRRPRPHVPECDQLRADEA
jgi:hypothetical protein